MAVGLASALAFGAPASAETLDGLLQRIIENHDRIAAAKADVESARNRAREALGVWFPSLEPTYNYGWEKQNKPGASADTSTAFTELDLKLKQLLWDFGKSNAQVEKGRLRLLQAEVSLVAKRQDLILEGATAYVNLLRTERVLGFASQSQENIRRQTGLEEARVETGMGLSTDVLQAKTQLAGAEARRIQASGANVSSRNRYLALFGEAPADVSTLEAVAIPPERLPLDLGSALTAALDNNTDLALANLAEATAREDVREVTGREFFPKIEGVVERKFKHNVGGTIDNQHETLAKVEMSLPFNLGFTAVNTLRASQSDLVSRTRTVADTRTKVEEQVRNAWVSLNTARATAGSLRNQADIASAFLELAREERKLGTRSLIDVLSGETSLINAQSDATSAEVDVLVATFQLLRVMGRLNYEVFQSASPLTLDELLRRRASAAARSFAGPVFKDAETIRLADGLFPPRDEARPLRRGTAADEAAAVAAAAKPRPAAAERGPRTDARAPDRDVLGGFEGLETELAALAPAAAATPRAPKPSQQGRQAAPAPAPEITLGDLLRPLRSLFGFAAAGGAAPPAPAKAGGGEPAGEAAADAGAKSPAAAAPREDRNQGAGEFSFAEFLAAILGIFGFGDLAPEKPAKPGAA